MSSVQTVCAFWNGIGLTIRYTPQKWGVMDHLEIMSDNRQPLPITRTGYKSLFLCPEELDRPPVDFVLWLLDNSAEAKDWSGDQLSLF